METIAKIRRRHIVKSATLCSCRCWLALVRSLQPYLGIRLPNDSMLRLREHETACIWCVQ